jgi:hypothetical protein
MTFTNEELQAMNAVPQSAKTPRQPFVPNRNNAARRNAAKGAQQPTKIAASDDSPDQPITPLDDTTSTIATAIGSMSEYSAHSTEALATQREVIADRVADQMAALLDPDLFLQDVMKRTVAKLNQRTVEIPNFFDIAFDLPPTPKVRHLPATPEAAP